MVLSAGFARPPTWALASVIGLVGLAGCYNPPALQEGAPCQRSEQCPDPQECVLGSCSQHAAASPDAQPAPPPDARLDAMIDAMPVPCVPTGLDCGGATPTMITCGTQCWMKCTNLVMRDAAETAYTGWGGALGEIDDPTEQSCVAAKVVNANFWLGAIQANTGAALPADKWTWNGDPTRLLNNYNNWDVGKPDDADGVESGQEQCATIRPGGAWDDDGCGQMLGFFCRRPMFR
jgi:hypothetical protein